MFFLLLDDGISVFSTRVVLDGSGLMIFILFFLLGIQELDVDWSFIILANLRRQ
jgi:hypothetical protein